MYYRHQLFLMIWTVCPLFLSHIELKRIKWSLSHQLHVRLLGFVTLWPVIVYYLMIYTPSDRHRDTEEITHEFQPLNKNLKMNRCRWTEIKLWVCMSSTGQKGCQATGYCRWEIIVSICISLTWASFRRRKNADMSDMWSGFSWSKPWWFWHFKIFLTCSGLQFHGNCWISWTRRH